MNRGKMDKRLREFDERYRLLMDRALEAIWFTIYEKPIDITLPEMEIARLMNETGIIVEANATTAKEYGFDEASQLIGRHWSEFMRHPHLLAGFILYQLTRYIFASMGYICWIIIGRRRH